MPLAALLAASWRGPESTIGDASTPGHGTRRFASQEDLMNRILELLPYVMVRDAKAAINPEEMQRRYTAMMAG
jgi:hypothetical protein